MLEYKDISFPVEIRDIRKIENINSIGIRAFRYENKEKYPIYLSKKSCEEKHVHLSLIGKEKKSLCSDHIIDSCMIIHYVTEENIFKLRIASKLIINKRLRGQRKRSKGNAKILKEKQNHHL